MSITIMRASFLFVATLLGTAACQQQQPSTVAVTEAAPAVATPLESAPVEVRQAVTTPALTPEMALFLTNHDLAALLEKHPDSNLSMNGFYGPDHYRVEFVLLSVRPDGTRPGLYHVRGKDRYKGTITPFEGEIEISQVLDQPPLTADQLVRNGLDTEGADLADLKDTYSATGRFELREDPRHKGAGVINGRFATDFILEEGRQLREYVQSDASPSEGGGVLFEGTWVSNHTGKVQPVAWVSNIFGYGPKVLNEFAIGERDVTINPKYARLGWNTYWENDEWWAEPNAATVEVAQMTGF